MKLADGVTAHHVKEGQTFQCVRCMCVVGEGVTIYRRETIFGVRVRCAACATEMMWINPRLR